MPAPRLLRTRVARRILWVFLVCAVVPVIAFATVSYLVTARRLERDAVEALQNNSKAAGMFVIERLISLRSALAGPVSADEASFTAVVRERPNGRTEVLRGAAIRLPPLTDLQRERLRNGRAVLLAEEDSGTVRRFLVLPDPVAGSAVHRWGLLSSTAILDSTVSPAPQGMELGLHDELGRNVLTTTSAPHPDALVGRWTMFLANEFGAPAWTISLTMPEAAAIAPLLGFRRTFLLGVVLAIGLVFLFSHMQIRKRMEPLAELEAGVKRIGMGQFQIPVEVKSDDEFQMLAGSFNHMAEDLSRQLTTLNALRAIDVAALEARSVNAIADAALRWAPDVVGGVRSGMVWRSVEHADSWHLVSAGPNGSHVRESQVRISDRERLEFDQNDDFLLLPPESSSRSYCPEGHFGLALNRVVFPLRLNGRVHAALILARSQHAPFGISSMAAGRQLADQLAVGLANVTRLGELDALSLGSMLALARTIDAASHWTAGHSERVTHTAVQIARRMGCAPEEVERLRRGALLHDIGKLGVPTAILEKPAALTDEERLNVQRHPEIGVEILTPIGAFQDLIPLVRSHHELLDGTGYPDGLAGDKIPEIVRVLTVADIYDALVSDRPYRRGLTPGDALEILRKGAGLKFDRKAVRALEQVVTEGWTPDLEPRLPGLAARPEPVEVLA